jgi:hypothetical protein
MIRFFVCNDVSWFILNEINEINSTISNMDKKIPKPFFLYSYSIFESTLTEILRYYLIAFPEKIDNTITLGKDELLSNASTYNIIKSSVNKHIRKYSCKPLSDYIAFFKNSLSIHFDVDEDKIKKISETRNIITHDDANHQLLFLHTQQQPDLSPHYSDVISYAMYLCDLLNDIRSQINEVYNKYTYEFLLRSIWSYAFTTPLLDFDHIWEFSSDGTLQIKDIKQVKERIVGISSSERLLLSIFLQQYNDTLNEVLHPFSNIPALVSMSSKNKEKIVNIINFFIYYPKFFNNTPIK